MMSSLAIIRQTVRDLSVVAFARSPNPILIIAYRNVSRPESLEEEWEHS
jgi:hypothetical protein